MSLKYKHICILFLLSFMFFTIDAHAQNESLNEIYIEVKSVDYSNYLLYADVKVNLNLNACDNFLYLILPISYNSNIHFYIDPESKKETILSGYLGRDGNFIAQFPPSDQSSEYFLTFTDVQIPINETSNSESYGYYSFSFDNINEDITNYKYNLILIDKIHITDNNHLYAEPNAVQESKNSLLFTFIDTPYNILIYISRQPTNTNFLVPIVVGISAAILGIIASLGAGIDARIKKCIKYKKLLRIVSLAVIIFEVIFFYFCIYLNGYYNDLTVLTTMSTLFGVSIATSFIIYFSTRGSV